MAIDIAEVGGKILDLGSMPTDDCVFFLEQIRLFYEDVKNQSKYNIKGCKYVVINGWSEKVKHIVIGKEKLAQNIISEFYEEVYNNG